MTKAIGSGKQIKRRDLKTKRKTKKDDARLDADYNPTNDDCDSVDNAEEPAQKQTRVRRSRF